MNCSICGKPCGPIVKDNPKVYHMACLIESVGEGQTMNNKMADNYLNGECPDCGLPIPDFTFDGEECKNCGHVFWSTENE